MVGHYTSSTDPIGGESQEKIIRAQCIAGSKLLEKALIAAGHWAPAVTAPVEAVRAGSALAQSLEPSPEPSIISQLQERINELEDILQIGGREGPFKAQKIALAVAKKHGLKYSDLKSPRRLRELVNARQEAMWLIRRECPGLSLPAIGRLFGGRDHTTVLWACRAHEKRLNNAGSSR